jgi:hypothetical protein
MVNWFAILAISTQWERGYSGERNENVIHVVSLSLFLGNPSSILHCRDSPEFSVCHVVPAAQLAQEPVTC